VGRHAGRKRRRRRSSYRNDQATIIQLARAIAARHNHPSEIVSRHHRTRSQSIRGPSATSQDSSRDTSCRNTTPKTRHHGNLRPIDVLGLGQIMGQTARELGFEGKYLPELCDPARGD